MREVKRSACPHDCPDTCSLLVEVEDGRIKRISGDPDHPFTRGIVCHKVRHYDERVYSPIRIKTPLKRIGGKGEGKFKAISWEEAIGEIGHQFKKIIDEFGPEAILPYSYGGTMGVVHRNTVGHRFFHRLGASRLDRTICCTTGLEGMTYSNGTSLGMDSEDFALSKMIILWGINSLTTNIHLMPFVQEAQKKGAKLVVIDPYRNRTGRMADWYVPIRPGTDSALAMAMIRVIIEENLYDKDYVEQRTVGFEALEKESTRFSLERVSQITGVPEAEIRRLAVAYATLKPSSIRIGFGMQRHSSGGMTFRTISCLPALTGGWDIPGGGAFASSGSAFALNWKDLTREDLLPRKPRTVNMIHLGEALLNLGQPPVKALFVYHCNPAAVAPYQAKVLTGLERKDLFTVVHEQVLTDTTDYADLVLPATTFLEHTDLYTSYGHFYIQMARPVIKPVGESKSNLEVFRLLAETMGFEETCFSDSEEDIIHQALQKDDPYMAGITFEGLSSGHPRRLNIPKPFLPFENGFPTPSGKVEFYSETLARKGFPPVATHVPTREGCESVQTGDKFTLHCITPPAHSFLNTTFGVSDRLRRIEKRPTLRIHPTDAKPRKIRSQDLVRVYNDRGAYHCFAQLTKRVVPGVVVAESIWWNKHSPLGSGINQLVSDEENDMGGGPGFHGNLVEVDLAHI
ncbi:MAG: molybdopterin-dependent oxidoreductase [Proteobacteria bacterium]|nr:molybdopterin-dependent oxidoreductase [Pseudomonadota bacterium]